MKPRLLPLLLVLALALAAGMVWYFRAVPATPDPAVPVPPAPAKSQGPPPTRTLTDATALFRKAFWREPGAEDRIAHAERQEWSDSEGVTRWAWFLEVHPSRDLEKYLREENAFGLIPAASASLPARRPAWFQPPSAEVTVLRSPRGQLQLIFLHADNRLFACDTGQGFQRGAPAAGTPGSSPDSPPARPASAPGRLPNTPPPLPKP